MNLRCSTFASVYRCWSLWLCFLGSLFALPISSSAVLDLNKDGISDIWALYHSQEAQAPNADADGDGLTNTQEAAAGTDPRSPTSIIRIVSMSLDGTGLHLTFPTQTGKRYQVQSAGNLAAPVWENVGSAVAGTNANVSTTSGATGATEKFYRVLVQDVDSDGDGVTDWEELTLGYDPNSSRSNGIGGDDDLTTITKALQAPNVVSVSALEPNASEPSATASGGKSAVFQISRSGNLNALTIRYSVSGAAISGTDYAALSGQVILPVGAKTATIDVTPLPDNHLESAEAVVVTILPDASYTPGQPGTAGVLIADATEASGDGVLARYWNNTSATIPTFSNTNVTPNTTAPRISRIEPQINNTWGTASPGAGVNADYFVSRYTADVLPEFSQVYTFEGTVDRGGRLWVDGKLLFSSWNNDPPSGTYSGTVELQAGRRYPIVFEHLARSGTASAILRWASQNRAKEVIPQARLFSNAPPQITSVLQVLLIKGSPEYTYQISASGEPTSFQAVNLPPGWTVNPATGVITGSPVQDGQWDIILTASNANGSGSAILQLHVITTGGGITREVWNGLSGSDLAAIPLTAPAATSEVIGSLEAPQDAGDSYGQRLRGYVHAPVTGAYSFWLAANDAAELWIANDEEPVNKFLRAKIPAPGIGHRDWSNAAQSPLLWLEAGRRYYVEVLHKEGTGADHLSVGWMKPGDSETEPAEVVPGYALSPWTPPVTDEAGGTLFTTSMSAQGAAATGGYGSATLRLSADETQAILTFSYANLTTPVSAKHVHADPWRGKPSEIIYDIDDFRPRQDGSYVWDIVASGSYSAADIVQLIKEGASYINIHTANYPAGEIRGNFRLQDGVQTFVAPTLQTWSDPNNAASIESSKNPDGAARLLIQATYGPTPQEITRVQSLGFEAWIEDQFTKPPTLHMDVVNANRNVTDPGGPTFGNNLTRNAWWKQSITAPDQLRQRVAFALSEIAVVSTEGPLSDRANAVSDYYDTLLTDAFGNFRTVLENVTLHPAMGRYLDMLRNDRPDKTRGRIPNENYAREILQLFAIGLNRMHPDGSLVLSSKGLPIATYDQDVIVGFAHAFTGWDYFYTGALRTTFGASSNWIEPMREVPARHYIGPKRILNNVVLPGMPTFNNQPLDPDASPSTALRDDPTFQALPRAELQATHDAIFNHPNVGPFICRQLIQRLVTSTPSRGYIYRVVQAFNGERNVQGVRTGVRGDMKEVIKAILLDYEARSASMLTRQGYGKQREPVLRITALARAFQPVSDISGVYGQAGATITVTSPVPHGLSTSNTVALSFTGSPAAAGGSYSVASVSGNTFMVRAKEAVNVSSYTQSNGTAGQAGSIIRVVTANSHGLSTGDVVTLDFSSGTPSAPADGPYQVSVVNTTTFTCIAVDNEARTGGGNSAVVAWLKGGYRQSSSGTTVTITCATPHGLSTGEEVSFGFEVDSGSSLPNGVYPVTVLNETEFTIEAASAVSRTGEFVAGIKLPNVVAAKLTRSGNVTAGLSTWRMDSTETDLGQTPLDSPTVFNYFEPDYQFPGTLAQAGLVTPEFQLTSDTNVVRQVNFIYNGVFNPSTSSAFFSAFKSGGGAIGLDFTPWSEGTLAESWLGAKPAPAEAWTSNANLGTLIDRLSTLLLAGQLPSSGTNNYTTTPRTIVNAKQVIMDFVRNTTNIPYNNSAPTGAEKRNRMRAIIHLLTTSPDFTIQK